MATIQAIIQEADIRVPNNPFDNAQKASWLNEVNQSFFDVVKIPKVELFTTTGATYMFPGSVKAKNIESVLVGNMRYLSYLHEAVRPGQNAFFYDDGTGTMTLDPIPANGLKGRLKYYRTATSTYTSGNMASSTPDAPEEYHWIYILGLCEKIAKAMDDVAKANNYGGDFRGNLLVAQQNYQR